MKYLLRLFILLFVLGIMVMCKKENQPPEIKSTMANPQNIKTGEITQLTCIAVDPESDKLTYLWSSSNGSFPNGNNSSSISWKAPDEPGNYSISVFVIDGKNTSNGSVNVTVKVNPQLSVSSTEIDFGTEGSEKTVEIKNTGTGILSWTVSEDLEWLTVSQQAGEVSTGTDTTTLTVNRASLAPGNYNGIITLTTNNGSEKIFVTMIVEENPVSLITPINLEFGISTTQLTFSIENVGTGTLNWTISESIDWLTLDKISGNSTTNPDQVTATVARSGLSPRKYSGVIKVSSNGGNKDIQVTMEIQENPELTIKPVVLSFDSSTKQDIFIIENSGTGNLDWTISANKSWIQLNFTSGTTTIEPREVIATIDWNGLSGGSYTGVISINSNGGNQQINVTMEVPDFTGTFVDQRDGNEYNWVRIGNQIWMSENLAYLPKVNLHSDGSHTEPFYYVMAYSGTNISTAKATDYYKTYGVLYNWTAAKASCPTGWHLPSDSEFTTLKYFLINNGYGFEGSGDDIAKSLAAKTNWDSYSFPGTPGNSPENNNQSGFSGLPGGSIANGVPFPAGYSGYWFSATLTDNKYVSVWYLTAQYTDFDRMGNGNFCAYNVRCIKD